MRIAAYIFTIGTEHSSKTQTIRRDILLLIQLANFGLNLHVKDTLSHLKYFALQTNHTFLRICRSQDREFRNTMSLNLETFFTTKLNSHTALSRMIFCEIIFHLRTSNFILYYHKLNLKRNSDSRKRKCLRKERNITLSVL